MNTLKSLSAEVLRRVSMNAAKRPSTQALRIVAALCGCGFSFATLAQTHSDHDTSGTNRSTESSVSHSGHTTAPATATPAIVDWQHLDFGQMIGVRPLPGGLASSLPGETATHTMDMNMPSTRRAPADARSPDYSEGFQASPMHDMEMGDTTIAFVTLDQLEYAGARHGADGLAFEAEGGYGKDFNKLWIKAEGELDGNDLHDLRTEVLWNHAVTGFWNTQVGARHDAGVGPNRTWAALGVQGLTPYLFETEATLYLGDNGRSAARFELEYEALLTQRLILQPKFEMNVYGKDDPARGLGSGISDTEFGLRLRYEIRREFAPYIGISWHHLHGDTANFARSAGESTHDFQIVAGVRMWFVR